MGWSIKYCPKCQKVYAGAENKCPSCKALLLTSQYDSEDFFALSDEQKVVAIEQLFGDGENNVGEDGASAEQTPIFDLKSSATAESRSDNTTSGVGTAIKVVSVVIIVLSVIGSFIIMGMMGVAGGLAVLLVSLLTGLLAFGIGEICTLLKRIDSRLREIEKK